MSSIFSRDVTPIDDLQSIMCFLYRSYLNERHWLRIRSLWKESLNSNCQQCHQYEQNKQSLLTLTHWTQRETTTYDIELFSILVFSATFSNILAMATSFSGGGSRSTRREPPTLGKELVNFITCGCESSAPFCNLQSWPRTHDDIWYWESRSNE
jgi:hypothetical protein